VFCMSLVAFRVKKIGSLLASLAGVLFEQNTKRRGQVERSVNCKR
jgi:hypothetical protein